MSLRLVKLTPEYREQLFDMMDEWTAFESHFSPYAIRRLDYHDFQYYLNHLETKEKTAERVPDSVFFALDTERNIFVGAVNLRHSLENGLGHTGGHIGDGVRPSERGKGYATRMIALALEEARKLGINKVLMTCDRANTASARTIQKNGGVMDYEVVEDGIPEQRYWITLQEETVETARLFLRRIMPADYREAFRWHSDHRVCRWRKAPVCQEPEQLRNRLENCDPNDPHNIRMLICDRRDSRAIGEIGCFYHPEREVWELGFAICYDAWGHGYAKEAAEAMMTYLQTEKHAHIFEAQCAAENEACRKLLEKLRMQHTGNSCFEKRDRSAVFPSRIYRLEW